MKTLSWVLLMYFAAVSQLMTGDGGVAVDLSAVAVVCAANWFSPGRAVISAFLMGLLLDGLGTGPLGLQAATLVGLAALLCRCGFAAGPQTVGRWMWAVLLTAWCSQVIGTGIELVPSQRWDAWEQLLIQHSLTGGVTAVAVGVVVGGWRQLTGTPCTTH